MLFRGIAHSNRVVWHRIGLNVERGTETCSMVALYATASMAAIA